MRVITTILFLFLFVVCRPQTIQSEKLYKKNNTDSVFRVTIYNGDTTWSFGFLITRPWGMITGSLSNQTDLQNILAGKAASFHTHAESEVTNLVSDLAGKSAINHTHAIDSILLQTKYRSDTARNNSYAFITGKEPVITTLSFAKGGIGAGAATSATTGTMTVNMTTEMITVTPTGACTFNASGGVTGQRITFVITTSGVSSFVLTFGTNFKSVGTLATGTTTAKIFSVSFLCTNAVQWIETSRTIAM